MNDRHPTELLSAYLDGEVASGERIEVARHLDACAGCRALLEDFRTLASVAAQEPPPPVPDGMVARIVAALEPRPFFARWIPLPVAVATGLLVVVTGTWFLVRRPSDRQPVTVAQAGPESRPAEPAAPDEPAGHRREAAPPATEVEPERSDRPATVSPPAEKEATAKAQEPAATGEPLPGLLAPTGSEEKTRPALGETGGSVAAYRLAAREPGERSIEFEVGGAKATLTEAGIVTLVQDQGACRVDLSVVLAAGDEVRSIFRLASAAPAPRAAAAADEATEAAPSQESASAAKAAASAEFGVAAKATQEKRAEKPVTLIRILSPAARPIDAASAVRIEKRLRHLLDATARDLIESRCGGPSPRSPSDD